MKMPVPKLRAKIEDGKIVPREKESFNLHLAMLEGKEVSVIIRKWEEEKTRQQLAYFFGVVVPVALGSEEFGGWTKEEFYGYVKSKFFKKMKKKKSGGVVSIISGFSQMTKDEAREKIRKIIRWLAIEHNCFVPNPEEVEIRQEFAF